tara:strand:- start:27 stop:482 length:456 start_codon:yes stop_codon:yes gene_type:complete
MPDFADSKIYKLYSNNLPDTCYIGSTVSTLKLRLSLHVSDAKLHNKASRQIIDVGDYHIEELEAFPCTSNLELRKREQHWMDKHVCCNERRAFVTEEEEKERIRVNNAKHNAKRSKVPVQCFCGGKYQPSNKSIHYKSKKHQAAVDIISMI